MVERFVDASTYHLQLAWSVNTPPRIGPTTEAIPNMDAVIAKYIARFRKGTEYARMLMPPEKSAAAPQPAMARPMMSILELTAVAQRIDPTILTSLSDAHSHFERFQ